MGHLVKAHLSPDDVHNIRKSLANPPIFIDDLEESIGLQSMELDFSPAASSKAWPEAFQSCVNGMPPLSLCKKLDRLQKAQPSNTGLHTGNVPSSVLSTNTAPRHGQHYHQFCGKGSGYAEFICKGILHPLPPQQGIPGWQRITFVQYLALGNGLRGQFPPDYPPRVTYDWDIDICSWSFEGVVLPGGKIMMGRWWSPTEPDRAKLWTGPFLYWEDHSNN